MAKRGLSNSGMFRLLFVRVAKDFQHNDRLEPQKTNLDCSVE